MTQHSLRITGTFWGLDTDLAHRRHFPAISWTRSYSLYLPTVTDWYREQVAPDWREGRDRMMQLLQREVELQEIVQVVGPDALPEREKAVLEIGRIIREDFLQQFAFDPVDGYCPLDKQHAMLEAILGLHAAVEAALERGVALSAVLELPEIAELARMKELAHDTARERIADLARRMAESVGRLEA